MVAVVILVVGAVLLPSIGVADEAVPRPLAVHPETIPTAPFPLDAFDCEGQIRFEQLPNGASGLSTQDDLCYPFESEVADDVVGDGTDLIGVGWWGVYWNGSPLPPDAVNIRLFADDAGAPGDLLHETTTFDYDETAGDPLGYCTNEIGGWPLSDEITYHLSIQASLCFPPQWGWSTGDGNGVELHLRSIFYEFPDWTPAEVVFGVPYDAAFLLYVSSGGGTPVAEASWTALKAHYR